MFLEANITKEGMNMIYGEAILLNAIAYDDPDFEWRCRERIYEARRLLWRVTWLELVVEVLERIPDGVFKMTDWFTQNDCGTQACAIGHCAMTPLFNAWGLTLVEQDDYFNPCYTCEDGYCTYSFSAVQDFFLINYDLARYLFNPSRYDDIYSIVEVKTRIQSVIEGLREGETW